MSDEKVTKILCKKCGQRLSPVNFYTKRNKEKFDYCKKCMLLHFDAFNLETFDWILKEADVPYIELEWNIVRDKEYAKNPRNVVKTLGKYLSRMKLGQFKDYRYADSERLNEEQAKELELYLKDNPSVALEGQQLKERYEHGLISEAEYKTKTSAAFRQKDDEEQMIAEAIREQTGQLPESYANALTNPTIGSSSKEYIGPGADLAEDDRIYLAMKWGTMYTPNEWVTLEQNYTEMTESFDIRDADSINSLKMLCKANLKANQAIDMNDFDGFQKLSKVADGLRKSAKWTALQNKDELDGGINAIGKIVTFCEKEGGAIPRFDLSVEQDVIDTIINDNKAYIKDLFYSDPSLSTRVEQYLQKRELLDEQKRTKELALAAGIGVDDFVGSLTDEDIAEIKGQEVKDKEHDEKIQNGGERRGFKIIT